MATGKIIVKWSVIDDAATDVSKLFSPMKMVSESSDNFLLYMSILVAIY